MTVEAVRIALAEACRSINEWRASEYIRESVSPPEIQIARGAVGQIVLGRAKHTHQFVLRAYVQRSSEKAGQILLDALVEMTGPGSLTETLETDTVATAAGADYIEVKEISEVRSAEVGAISYLFVEFTVEVCY